MTVLDWILVAIVVVSALLSLLRGFTRELISLLAWLAALVGARLLAPSLAVLFGDSIAEPALRELLAFVLLFIAILVVGALVGHLVGAAVRNSPLSVSDRLLGVGFGLARGVIVLIVAVTLLGPWLGSEAWWQSSRLIPYLAIYSDWTRATAHATGEWVGGLE